ncbi:MAG: AIM24 family protein, partial [Proteobacteria bacterium]|nr:AIM24 family protein [Pseudomonadota bacterium]
IVHGAGDFIEQQLGPGERILVSTGNLAVFSSEVGFGITSVGGCKNMLFGGEGMFMTEMTGPGWVMLQSLKKLPAKKGKQQ